MGRLTFLKLGWASASFSGCVWNFLKATGSQILSFSERESFDLDVEFNVCHMINPYIVFDLYVYKCVGALGEGSIFS